MTEGVGLDESRASGREPLVAETVEAVIEGGGSREEGTDFRLTGRSTWWNRR